jgi:hypothetical protein
MRPTDHPTNEDLFAGTPSRKTQYLSIAENRPVKQISLLAAGHSNPNIGLSGTMN